jgi:hypothetical protein
LGCLRISIFSSTNSHFMSLHMFKKLLQVPIWFKHIVPSRHHSSHSSNSWRSNHHDTICLDPQINSTCLSCLAFHQGCNFDHQGNMLTESRDTNVCKKEST